MCLHSRVFWSTSVPLARGIGIYTGLPYMDDQLDEDTKQHLEYLYRRLKLLENAIRSLEALSETEGDEEDLGGFPKSV